MSHRCSPYDVVYFVQTSPYLALSKPAGALRFLKREVEAGEECASSLAEYPRLQIEPLAFFYTCLRSLGCLDVPFFESLVTEQTWRGVVWGSWLAMLEPRPELLGALGAARVPPINEWIVACAAAAIERRAPAPEHEAFAALAARFRSILAPIARPALPVRRMPTEDERAIMEAERESIRFTYATAGTDAALAMVPGTLVGVYAQDYRLWLRSSLRQRRE